MPFDFDTASLFISLIVGSVGLVLFVYGKKSERWPHLIAGLLLMAYPYFTETALSMTIVGAVIVAGLWIAVRNGY